MAKEILAKVKLHIPGGQATPAPPIAPALGQHGVSIKEFVNKFNEETKDAQGIITPVVITIYKDKSFTFFTKSPPASILLKRAAGIAKGSAIPSKDKVGTVTVKQLEEIAEIKKKDLNAPTVERAVEIIKGTARSMGIEVAQE